MLKPCCSPIRMCDQTSLGTADSAGRTKDGGVRLTPVRISGILCTGQVTSSSISPLNAAETADVLPPRESQQDDRQEVAAQ